MSAEYLCQILVKHSFLAITIGYIFKYKNLISPDQEIDGFAHNFLLFVN